ncbi:hypothetical protein M8J77_016871 [Diaphorina citri]|nr:hypothetical protein M8J77_016871 [Diaphorina citri]
MYMLLGDSQFVRMNNNFPFPSDTICLAVSGATVVETETNPWIKGILQQYLAENENLDRSQVTVFVMGGTNDFLRGIDQKEFQVEFKSLLRFVRKKFTKVIVCPPPPIPKLGIDGVKSLKDLNHWFYSLVPTVNTVDSFSSYMNPSGESPNMSLFEETFYDGRPDKIHLNEMGLFVLKHMLLTKDQEIR